MPADRGATTWSPPRTSAPAVFLAGADARFVDGVDLPVDGGLSAGSGLPNFAPGRRLITRPGGP